jgi:hypothetical protein
VIAVTLRVSEAMEIIVAVVGIEVEEEDRHILCKLRYNTPNNHPLVVPKEPPLKHLKN